MLKIICFFCICVNFLHLCSGVEVCGLEKIPKVKLTDTGSVEVINLAVNKWSVTPNGKGYFMIPLDPLDLKDVIFTVADEKFLLKNAKVTGLLDSKLKVTLTGSKEKPLYRFQFTHNVILDADMSIRTLLKNGEQYRFDSPVQVEIKDIITEHITGLQKVKRCNGNTYVRLTPMNLEVSNGNANIITGLAEQINGVDADDFKMTLVDTIGVMCTEAINKNVEQFHSIIKYDVIIAN